MLSKSTKIILNYTFGIGLFIWLTWSIYHQLRYKDNLHLSLFQLKESIATHKTAIIVVCCLMVANWSVEALKWQVLIKPLEHITFRKALYAILSGVSFSVNTPNRIGEYGGRILYLKGKNRISAISATMVGSFGQFITTLLFGIGGYTFYILNFQPDISPGLLSLKAWEFILLSMLLISTTLVIVFYFRLNLIVGLFGKIRWLRRWQRYIVIISGFSGKTLWQVLLYSIVRYLIFSAQYLILLKAMGVEMLWWQGFLMIYLIYLVMSLLPTLAIAELGIRGEVGLYFLGFLSANKMGIIAGTVGIWLINLLIPAILGSLLLLGIKVLNEEKITGILKKQRA